MESALSLLAAYKDGAKVIAGGQTLVPLMNLRLATPETVIDLARIEELKGIRRDEGILRIGAMTRQCQLLREPLIHDCAPLVAAAVPYIGHVQTRSRGTLGGSLVHADLAAELPLVMIALGARIVLRNAAHARVVAANDFFLDALTTDLAADELLTHVEVQVAPAGARVGFCEYARRHGDFALVAAAVQISESRDGGRQARVALGGATATPLRCKAVEHLLTTDRVDMAETSAALRTDLIGHTLLSDIHASGDYRLELASSCLWEAISEASI